MSEFRGKDIQRTDKTQCIMALDRVIVSLNKIEVDDYYGLWYGYHNLPCTHKLVFISCVYFFYSWWNILCENIPVNLSSYDILQIIPRSNGDEEFIWYHHALIMKLPPTKVSYIYVIKGCIDWDFLSFLLCHLKVKTTSMRMKVQNKSV